MFTSRKNIYIESVVVHFVLPLAKRHEIDAFLESCYKAGFHELNYLEGKDFKDGISPEFDVCVALKPKLNDEEKKAAIDTITKLLAESAPNAVLQKPFALFPAKPIAIENMGMNYLTAYLPPPGLRPR